MTRSIESVDGSRAEESPANVRIRGVRPRKPPQWWARPWIIPLTVLFVAVLGYWVNKMWGVWGTSQAPVAPHEGFSAYFPWLGVHMVAAFTAWISAIVQLWPRMRRRYPMAHRVSGWIYVLAAVVGGISALVIVRFAPAAGIFGAVVQTLVWVVTALIGFGLALRGRYALHRVYMLYSFAAFMSPQWGLLFWEVALRTPFITDPQFQDYLAQATRWVALLINLTLVHWWLLRRSQRRAAANEPLRGRRSAAPA